MEIDELKSRKAQLENDITDLIAKFEEEFALEEIECEQRQTQQPHHFKSCREALLDTDKLSCTHILCGVIRNSVSEGCKRSNYKVIELDRRRISCHYGSTEAVDNALNDYISD